MLNGRKTYQWEPSETRREIGTVRENSGIWGKALTRGRRGFHGMNVMRVLYG